MSGSLTITMRRPVPLPALAAAVERAFRDLIGRDAPVEARSEAGATELGAGEDEVRLRIEGAEVVLTVYSLPDHHCLPEDLAAFWSVVAPGGSGPAAMAGAAAVALGLARELDAGIVDGGGKWTTTRELDASAFESALRVPEPFRSGAEALERFAARLPAS